MDALRRDSTPFGKTCRQRLRFAEASCGALPFKAPLRISRAASEEAKAEGGKGLPVPGLSADGTHVLLGDSGIHALASPASSGELFS